MKNRFKFAVATFAIFSLVMSTPVFAKKDGDSPAGWSKGKKTGWGGENMPPGLAKSDVKKAEKEAKKKQKELEKEAKKKQKEIEKAAKKKQN